MEQSTISEVTPYSSLDVQRDVLSVPATLLLIEAWLAIKNRATDDDANAVVFKTVTTIPVETQGHILNTGASGTAVVLFVLTAEDTGLLRPDRDYSYGMKARLSNDKVGEFEQGTLTTGHGVVRKIS